MKINYSVFKQALIILCFVFSGKGIFSQTINVPYQFYLDANNNCTYDGGETYLYNLPGEMQLTYVNTTPSNITASNTAICGTSLAVINPSVPVSNSLVYINTYTSTMGQPTYPTFSYNPSCPAYTNLSYTATNYLPVKNIKQESNLFLFVSPNVGYYYNGDSLNNTFPVCYNIGSDSVTFMINADNIYTCNSTMASRTYSLYLDGILFDQITNTGMGYNVGIGTKGIIKETYTANKVYYYFNTTLPAGITALGNHTLSVQSSQLYNSSLAIFNYSCTLISSPCTRISGVIYSDCNSNCIKDAGDNGISTVAMGLVYQTIGSYSSTIWPDANGQFSCYLPNSVNPYYITSFSIVPTATACSNVTITLPPGASTNTLSFGYQSPNYNDPGVAITQIGNAAPSGLVLFKLSFGTTSTVSCTGFTLNPGKVKVLLPNIFTYSSMPYGDPAPTSIVSGPSGDTLIWNITDFNSIPSSNTYYFNATVSSTVTAGFSYTVNAYVTSLLDNFTPNNQSVFPWSIGYPCDPNDKQCYAQGIQQNGDIPFGVQDLFYTVNFQNVGTAPAIDVKTVDTMDVNLDLSTLQILQSSFLPQLQVDNISRQVIFYFQNINLPDSNTSEPASHGFVKYKIKLKPGVLVNTTIKNRAHNYFDFQPPVPTNQTKNKLVIITGINEIENSNAVFVAPNPATDELIISAKEIIQTVSIFNNLGQLISKKEINAIQTQLDLSTIQNSIYFVTVQLKDGSQITKKIIKN